MIERTLIVVALLSAGCGVHYWQRPGAGLPAFEQDSQSCIDEARAAPVGFEPEQMYRGCMRARGWVRVKPGVPEANQFRGPEDAADFDNPPSPTAGHGSAHSDSTTAVACRQPSASRPPGVVCRSR